DRFGRQNARKRVMTTILQQKIIIPQHCISANQRNYECRKHPACSLQKKNAIGVTAKNSSKFGQRNEPLRAATRK
ncbi:MAG: hypothetical protein ACIALR_03605, partial [Blastopirellula sp. JB062]